MRASAYFDLAHAVSFDLTVLNLVALDYSMPLRANMNSATSILIVHGFVVKKR